MTARMTHLEKSDWRRHFFYRKESVKTTWKFRIGLVAVLLLLVLLTRGLWTVAIAQSLICREDINTSDGLLLENFDPDYLVFEHAATLERAGVASRVLVPVLEPKDPKTPSVIGKSFTEMMAHVAHVPNFEVIPIKEIEPISLNAAKQILEYLKAQHVTSVVVVSPVFRSRRSFLVYNAVFSQAGIRVGCTPVLGTRNPNTWLRTWHGIQGVAEQFVKLQYYRFYVLLFRRP